MILNDLTANNGTFQGNIVGVTDINTTGTVSVGQDIHLRQLDERWFDTGGIHFDSQNSTSSGKICVYDNIHPKFKIFTPNGGEMEITTGTNTNNANGDLTLRGYNVFIGSKDGGGEIYVNNDVAAGRNWTEDKISKCCNNEIAPRLDSLQSKIVDLQRQINELKS